MRSRSPYGERGLKSLDFWRSNRTRGRSPYGRAWIEMSRPQRRIPSLSSRSPYGRAWIEIRTEPFPASRHASLSLRRAWIEICSWCPTWSAAWSLSLRRAWIEIRTEPFPASRHASLSLRRAWIEIRTVRWQNTDCRSLSLRRAWIEIFDGGWRGGSRGGRSPYGERGLKSCCGRGLLDVQASLSLRRAWIEISNPRPWNGRHESLSLRRAWIEIRIPANQPPQVAGRSPYGERGLK